jgi:hypothetical protein
MIDTKTLTESERLAQLHPRDELRELLYIANCIDPEARESVERLAIAALRCSVLDEEAFKTPAVLEILEAMARADALWEAEDAERKEGRR